jgi:hypothetical protein
MIAPLVDAAAPSRASKPGSRRLVSLGFTLHEDGHGLRGDADILRVWRLKLGVAAAWSHSENYDAFGDLALDDVLMMAQVAHDRSFLNGRIGVRASLSAGFSITSANPMATSAGAQSMLSPAADAVVTGDFAVSSRLVLRAGIAVALLPQRIHNPSWEGYHDRDVIPQLFVGLGYSGD